MSTQGSKATEIDLKKEKERCTASHNNALCSGLLIRLASCLCELQS